MVRHFAALNDHGIVIQVLLGSDENGSGDVSWFEKNVKSLPDHNERGQPILDANGKRVMVKPEHWVEIYNQSETPVGIGHRIP